jgi:hypothetical protein
MEESMLFSENFGEPVSVGGGLAINENRQVMGRGGPVIGLCAASDTTGSRFTNHDSERIEIVNDMTWAVAGGFLAGQNVGKQLKAV